VVSRHLASNATRCTLSLQHLHRHSQAPAATLHHTHRMNHESDTWRLLGSMPAIHRYRIHPQRANIHEVTVLNRMLAIAELDSESLHNRLADPGSEYGRLLGLTPATQRYKGRLCGIKTHEIADLCESCLYRYPGDPRSRLQIPPQPLARFWIRLRDIVGPDASYATV